MPILGNFPGGGGTNEFFGLCDSTWDSEEKEVSIPGVKLNVGTRIAVKFTYNNNYTGTHVIPKLNVNNTGPMQIKGTYSWESGDILEFVYVGNAWQVIGGGNATTESYGSVKLLSSDFDSMSCAEWYSVPTASKVKFALSDAKKKATTSSYGSVQLLPQSFPLSSSSYADTVPTAGQVDAIYNMAKTAKEQSELKATASSYGSVQLLSGGFPLSGCGAATDAGYVPTAGQVNAIYNMALNALNSASSVSTELSQLSAASLKFACSRYTGNGADSRTFTFNFKPYLFISIAESIFASLIVAIRNLGITTQSYVTDATKGLNVGWGDDHVTVSKYTAAADVGTINNFNQGAYAYFAIGV